MKKSCVAGFTAAVTLCCVSSSVHAAYIARLVSQGLSEITVAPGGGFEIDVMLTSDSEDTHNSSIFRVEFSDAGFLYRSYHWSAPYLNDSSGFDDSSPNNMELGGSGLLLTPSLLEGPGFPLGVVDVELSNVVSIGTFAAGLLVKLRVDVPLDYSGAETVQVQFVPDTFANGFDEIEVTTGGPLVVHIPTGSSAIAGVLAGAVLLRRRNR